MRNDLQIAINVLMVHLALFINIAGAASSWRVYQLTGDPLFVFLFSLCMTFCCGLGVAHVLSVVSIRAKRDKEERWR